MIFIFYDGYELIQSKDVQYCWHRCSLSYRRKWWVKRPQSLHHRTTSKNICYRQIEYFRKELFMLSYRD